jgi:TRAP-type mannitol/chloroaromatic compound transport system permease small subunit
MDLAYATWSDRTKAMVDAVTILCILFYLGVMIWGGIESLDYAIDTGERRRGLWRPYMWPVKAVMVLGLVMMLLQCTAFFIRDIAKLRGRDI